MSALSVKKAATMIIKRAEHRTLSKIAKMTKTEKLLDKALRNTLTIACENIKDKHVGFSYLTHTVNLKKPNNSLCVNCFFMDELALSEATNKQQLSLIEAQIQQQLELINIKPQKICFS